MDEIGKLLDELAGLGSLMTRGQLTQPRSVGPRIVGIAEEVRVYAATIDRLTAENERLRKALESIQKICDGPISYSRSHMLDNIAAIIETSLGTSALSDADR